jgi:hypothetical protein
MQRGKREQISRGENTEESVSPVLAAFLKHKGLFFPIEEPKTTPIALCDNVPIQILDSFLLGWLWCHWCEWERSSYRIGSNKGPSSSSSTLSPNFCGVCVGRVGAGILCWFGFIGLWVSTYVPIIGYFPV